jgi:hypothetical protein
MQSRVMREYAARRGWTIALQVREVGSGVLLQSARQSSWWRLRHVSIGRKPRGIASLSMLLQSGLRRLEPTKVTELFRVSIA